MRFYGAVGYGDTVDVGDGVHEDRIVERSYFGDVVRNARQLLEGEHLNRDLSLQNSISIVADAYANEHYFAIRYVSWNGVRWTVTKVEIKPPRLELTLGEVYNGPIPETTPDNSGDGPGE